MHTYIHIHIYTYVYLAVLSSAGGHEHPQGHHARRPGCPCFRDRLSLGRNTTATNHNSNSNNRNDENTMTTHRTRAPSRLPSAQSRGERLHARTYYYYYYYYY